MLLGRGQFNIVHKRWLVARTGTRPVIVGSNPNLGILIELIAPFVSKNFKLNSYPIIQ